MFIKQKYDWDCGAAAFANSYYIRVGKHIKLARAVEICGTTPSEGTNDLQLVEALKAVGFNGCLRREPSNQKRAFGYLTPGDIVCLDRWSHWVVVVQKLKETIIIHDPEEGLVELTRKKFKKRWKFMGTYFFIAVR